MEDNRQLLERFWAGNCTKEELVQVEKLLKSVSGRKMFDEIIEQSEGHKVTHPATPDTDRLELIRSKEIELAQYMANSNTRPSRPFLTRTALRWSGIAAVFAGVVILSSIFLLNNNNGTGLFGSKEQAIAYAELSNPNGIPELHQLPDGTKIWLAAGSTLKYPEQFSEKHRDVELTGEAFFDVARDEARPFTIRTGDMQTRVLGTSFKITAFAGQQQEVSVATGKVRVSSNGQQLALLTRGLQVRRNPQTGETTQTEIDPATLEEWKTGTLIFDEMPMSLIAKQLESRYGISIEFANAKAANSRVGGTFSPQQSASEVLSVLGFVGDFQFKSAHDKQYTIY